MRILAYLSAVTPKLPIPFVPQTVYEYLYIYLYPYVLGRSSITIS